MKMNKRAPLPSEKFRLPKEDIFEVLQDERKSTLRVKKLLPSPLGSDNLQINLDEYICERFEDGEHILFSSDVMKQNWA